MHQIESSMDCSGAQKEGLSGTPKFGSLWYIEGAIKALAMDEITQGNSTQ